MRELLVDGPLPSAEAVAVTLAVLSALGGLHRAGRMHGGVSEDSVGVAADGWVRLAADAARDDRRGPAGDLRDTGVLLCRLLGAPQQDDPRLPSSEAEKTAPALVAVARSLADGGTWSADEAWTAVREAAGYWGAEPQLVRALGELAARVDGATTLEQAVTRIVIGPPLRSEPPPPVREERDLGAALAALPQPDLRRLLRVRPVLPPLPSLKAPSVPLPSAPRPGRRFGLLAALALAIGVAVGAAAGVHAVLRPARTAAAGPAAQPKHAASPAPRLEGLYAQTPSATVSMFFQLVQEQRLDQAALLWKAKMASQVDLQTRFSGISNIDLRRDDIVAENDQLGIATVAVDWVETDADGTTHEYAGQIYTDTGPVLWRWDSWNVQEVTPGGSSGDGGDGG